MKARRSISFAMLILFLGSMACNLPSNQPATQDPYAAAALTVTALAQTADAIRQNPFPTSTPTSGIPTSTMTPLGPPAITRVAPSATPGGSFFVVDVGANCRLGPGTDYDKITSFAQGAYLALVGRNVDSTWWYVRSGSTNCWISASTGHTTGPLAGVAVMTPPPSPTPIPIAGPKLSDPTALQTELSYPSNCTSNIVTVAIRVTDNGNGINTVWLNYRYVVEGSYTGNWHTVSPNDNASGGVNGFNYPIGSEAASELGTQNGMFQYQFFAKDNLGNTSSYPATTPLAIPIKYCP